MKIPKEIPNEQLTDEERKIKQLGGIITEETRKKAATILNALEIFNQQKNEDLSLNILEALKAIELIYKKLANKK